MTRLDAVIIEDHKLIADAWASVLKHSELFKDIHIYGYANKEIILEVADIAPAIVLLDINLPGANGINVAEELLDISPLTKILMLSLHNEFSLVKKALRVGVKGYVTKNSPLSELNHAVKTILNGENYVCEEIEKAVLQHSLHGNGRLQNYLSKVTPREVEIINLISQGLNTKEMADKLSITPKTIEVHKHNIYNKLNVKNAPDLIRFLNANSVLFE